MRIKEAVILAGGLGTRLRSSVPDLPKCMAPVRGRPFIAYLIDYFQKQGVERFVFSLGYKHEVIQEFLHHNYPSLDRSFSVEEYPLGTGGAIKLALRTVKEENVLILNGDTFFGVDNHRLRTAHLQKGADCTLSLKPMHGFDRYGVVELNADHSVKSFKEKKYYKEGLINGGVYVLNKRAFEGGDFPEKFSFEKEYLETQALKKDHKLFALVEKQYFIDIGIPQDYERAQIELPGNIAH